MKEIKTKECSKAPKLKNPASRMPKELMRDAFLKVRENHQEISKAYDSGGGQESPVEYADRKTESAEVRVADTSVRAVSMAGRMMAKKSYEKMRGYRQEQFAAEEARENTESFAGDSSKGNEDPAKDYVKEKVRETKLREKKDFCAESGFNKNGLEETGSVADRIKTKIGQEQANARDIKVRKYQRETFYSSFRDDSGKTVKTISRNTADGSILPIDKIRTGYSKMPVSEKQPIHTAMQKKTVSAAVPKKGIASAVMPKKQAEYAARASRQMAVKSARATRETAQSVKKTARIAVKGIAAAIKAAVSSTKILTILASAGGGLAVFLILVIGVIGGVLLSGNNQSTEPLSQEVMDYAPVIQKYAKQYDIPEYVQVIQAIMMQESRGQGNDPMQASECPFNTRYGNSPNSITDPEYSIQVGIQYYAYCVQEAGCTNPQDLDKLKLSIQGYNYGNGYISWALRNHGGYSEANALQFSQEQAAAHGWSGYGDPEYVPHVMRYYSGGNLFAGLFGNSQIVSVAMSQVGNQGGEKFWSWYGFNGRVEWCGCFVSWCSAQCGLIESGAVPKFASCPAGVEWFRSNGKWKDNTYSPAAGTIIFFDWNGDGMSDHVGIVEKCENGRVYTVEGNSGDTVRQESYIVETSVILGYGLLV